MTHEYPGGRWQAENECFATIHSLHRLYEGHADNVATGLDLDRQRVEILAGTVEPDNLDTPGSERWFVQTARIGEPDNPFRVFVVSVARPAENDAYDYDTNRYSAFATVNAETPPPQHPLGEERLRRLLGNTTFSLVFADAAAALIAPLIIPDTLEEWAQHDPSMRQKLDERER